MSPEWEPNTTFHQVNSPTGGATVFTNQGTGDLVVNMAPMPEFQPVWPMRVGVVPTLVDAFQPRAPAPDRWRAEPGTSIVSGLGGVGKTALAAAYAHRCWAERSVDLLIWVSATSRASVVSTYALALRSVTGAEDSDPDQAASRFLSWLATTERRWLIALDDVRSPADMRGLWPPTTGSGRTIVTTRRRDEALTGPDRRWLPLSVFEPVESRAYLLRKVPALARDPASAARLAADLGHLPLALAQVAAYMIDRGIGGPEYLDRLADRRRHLVDVLPEQQSLPDEHRATVAATWSLSVEAADRLRPAGLARPILHLASVLDPHGIPAAVFGTDAALSFLTNVGGDTGNARDAADAMDGVHNLARLNLVSIDEADQAVRVHALVQRATRESLTVPELTSAYRIAAQTLAEVWPDVEPDRAFGQTLRANADAVSRLAGDLLWHPDPPRMLFRAGRSKGESGLVTDAIDHFRGIESTATRLLGPADHAALASRAATARWSGIAGDPATAARLFAELLDDQVKALPPHHPDLLATAANMAYWRGQAGDLSGAITATEDTLEEHLRLLGPDHPSTLAVRSNLAYWHGRSGAVMTAVAEFEALVRDRARLLGADHPETLTTRHNAARWRGEAGAFADAIAALADVLADRVRIHGPDDPRTLNTIAHLAHFHAEAGDLGTAVATFEDLLAKRERILGPDHPDTLNTRHQLARCHSKPDEAVARFEDLLADQIRALGADHPQTLNTRAAIAYGRGRAGAYADAAAWFQELLADRRRVLGPDHPDTRRTVENVAYWKAAAERGIAAEPMPGPPPAL